MSRNFGAIDGVPRRLNPFTLRTGWGLALLLSTLALAQAARADQIMSVGTTFFSGTESQTIALNAPGAGTVSVKLNDLLFPDALQSLSFFASTDTTVLQSKQIDPTTYQFSLTGAGAFYAHIAGVAGQSGIPGLPNFGLYGTQITFSPLVTGVPLPPAIWLLAAGMCGLLGLGVLRRKSVLPEGLASPLAAS